MIAYMRQVQVERTLSSLSHVPAVETFWSTPRTVLLVLMAPIPTTTKPFALPAVSPLDSPLGNLHLPLASLLLNPLDCLLEFPLDSQLHRPVNLLANLQETLLVNQVVNLRDSLRVSLVSHRDSPLAFHLESQVVNHLPNRRVSQRPNAVPDIITLAGMAYTAMNVWSVRLARIAASQACMNAL